MFQIIQPKRALYVQASNCIEENEWLAAVVIIFSSPEHFVLRVSYCDRPLSVVVRRA